MHFKHPFKRSLKTAYKSTQRAGRHVADATSATYESLADSLNDARHSAAALTSTTYSAVSDTVDDAIDHASRRVQAAVEARLEVLVADVQARMLHEIRQRESGMSFIAIAMSLAVLSGIVLALAAVYVLTTLLDLPLWSGYTIVGILLAVMSGSFFVIGRQQLVRRGDDENV